MTWNNTHEFLFTCLLYVVGLGNIIRFPQLAYANGGGAFLLPYFLSLFFIGIPIFYLEVAFGQYASLGPITIWKVSPLFKGVGYGVVISNLLMAISYNVTIAWALYYMFASMQKDLPWSACQPHHLGDGCTNVTMKLSSNEVAISSPLNSSYFSNASEIEVGQNSLSLQMTTSLNDTMPFPSRIVGSTESSTVSTTTPEPHRDLLHPSEHYFYREFLKMSDGLEDFGYPHWRLSLCLLLAWVIVFVILSKGVKSAGKTALILTPFPYIILMAFLIQSFVKDSQGATNGIRYLVSPRWEFLSKASVWYDAVTQVFFSLSLMQGGLITLSSYNKFHHNIYRAAILIPVLDTVTSLFAALTVFSVLGVMANQEGADVSEVIRGSTGTAFITFTEAVTMMPVPQLWSALFFFMLICLGLGTQYVVVETAVTAVIDEYPEKLSKKRPQIIAIFCVILFILGIPLTCPGGVYLQTIVDKFSSSYAIFFLALTFNIALAWVYGISQLSKDIKAMIGKKLSILWKILWKTVTPLLLMIILVCSLVFYEPLHVKTYFVDYEFPVWARVIGWMIFSVQIIPLFVCAIVMYVTTPKAPIRKKLKKLVSPSLMWGPALEVHKLELTSAESVNSPTSRRAFDKKEAVKTGKDIGGLDSIFSATVGNNVLVKMAVSLTQGSNSEHSKAKGSSSKFRRNPSADLLAKRMDTSGDGPIMFQEDGETYMLVPKRKVRPPSVDKSTQTSSVYKNRSPRTSLQVSNETSFSIGSSSESINTISAAVDNNKKKRKLVVGSERLKSNPIDNRKGIDNPIIVIDSAS